jgi:diguanylate cyclase (GGDEF)-like protein
MYGLQHSENIKNFLRRINQTPSLQGATCFHTGNFNIAVLGLESLVEEYLLHPSGINLTNFDNVNDLIRENSLNTFDGIVINYQTDKIRNYILIRQLKEQLNIGIELPIIYLAFEAKHEDEIQAFALGANEFAQRKLGLDALSARLKNCLTQARVVRLLHRHAVIDGLTGILNKREFQQNLEKEWRNACRNKLSLSLVMIDIDFFKFYNDNYGHCAGDDILRKVANCLGKDLYRAKDVLARFGGEEFVILLPETKSHGLEFICQQIRSNIEHLALPHSASSISPYITISIGGCSATPHPDQTPTQMLKLADAALYQAKERGRNQYVLNELASISYD